MDIFSNLDPTVKILSLGISGFCFLLVIMSFKLISDEQKRDAPRKGILTAIFVFMAINFFNVIAKNDSKIITELINGASRKSEEE